MTCKKVAAFGAGATGAGTAQVMAAALRIALVDVKSGFVEAGMKRIDSRLASGAKKGKIGPEDRDRIMGLVAGSTNAADASDADLVIEAIVVLVPRLTKTQ